MACVLDVLTIAGIKPIDVDINNINSPIGPVKKNVRIVIKDIIEITKIL